MAAQTGQRADCQADVEWPTGIFALSPRLWAMFPARTGYGNPRTAVHRGRISRQAVLYCPGVRPIGLLTPMSAFLGWVIAATPPRHSIAPPTGAQRGPASAIHTLPPTRL